MRSSTKSHYVGAQILLGIFKSKNNILGHSQISHIQIIKTSHFKLVISMFLYSERVAHNWRRRNYLISRVSSVSRQNISYIYNLYILHIFLAIVNTEYFIELLLFSDDETQVSAVWDDVSRAPLLPNCDWQQSYISNFGNF